MPEFGSKTDLPSPTVCLRFETDLPCAPTLSEIQRNHCSSSFSVPDSLKFWKNDHCVEIIPYLELKAWKCLMLEEKRVRFICLPSTEHPAISEISSDLMLIS